MNGHEQYVAFNSNSPPNGIGCVVAIRREIGRKIRQIGVVGTVVHAARKITRDWKQSGSSVCSLDAFDGQFGVDTDGRIPVGRLDIPDDRLEHVVLYQAIPSDLFLDILGQLQVEHERFVFVDLGCGKGRALLLASRFPFKEIIGVELSATLCEIARRNIANWDKDPLQRCKRLRTVCLDAADYRLPTV